MSRKMAIWLHGGVGGGLFSQGQPPIQALVSRLSEHFEIEVYSVMPPHNTFHPETYRIVYPRWPMPRFAGWIYLTMKFLVAHQRKKYRILYAFWGYPAGSLAVVIGRLLGLPAVVHLQGGDAVKIPSLKYGVFYNPVRAAVCRYTYAKCARLIALSHYQAQCLKDNRVGRTPAIVPFGPDTTKFFFEPRRFDRPAVRFLHVGNQTPVKGQMDMLETFALLSQQVPCSLLIIGADYYNAKLYELCHSLNLESHVEFLGPQPHDHMPAFYHNTDILLHTPKFEGQGVVVAEAAACGTLIAGTAVGMLSDMGDNCGLIVSPGEWRILADKILNILPAIERREHIRQNAWHWVREKDVNYTVAEIVKILNELVPHDNFQRAKETSHEVERQRLSEFQQDQVG